MMVIAFVVIVVWFWAGATGRVGIDDPNEDDRLRPRRRK